jgi:hypothetical protein
MMTLYRINTGKFKDFTTGHVPRLNACIPLIAMLAVLVLLGGCTQFGPKALTAGRPLYNIAVQETESQQLLLNIVRQRYRDPVLFLDVTSISSGFNRQASAGLLGNTGSSNIGGTLGGSISESPFITYAPNTGEAFVRQMMTPLDISTLVLIVQAGWSIERTLLIVGESVNELRNTPSDKNPQTGYLKFHEVVSSLRDLQRDGKLSLGGQMAKDDAAPRLSLLVAPDAVKSEPYLRVCKAIKVACDGRPLNLRQGIGASIDHETMVLATRSLFSAMYFLSQGVDVPAKDVASGVAGSKSIVAGGPFDQAGTGETLFHVHASAEEPELASVKVFYRDSWFYIADNDADSKVTFALVSMMMMLQSGNEAKITPLITLPVG